MRITCGLIRRSFLVMTRNNSLWYTPAFSERFVRPVRYGPLAVVSYHGHRFWDGCITTFQLRIFIILMAAGWFIIFLLTFLVFYVIYKNVSNNLNGVTTKVGYLVQLKLSETPGRSTDGLRTSWKSIGQSTLKMNVSTEGIKFFNRQYACNHSQSNWCWNCSEQVI